MAIAAAASNTSCSTVQVLATRRAASAHVRVAFPTPKHITFANSFAGVRVPAQIALQRRVCASRVTAVSPVAEISYVMVKPDGVQRGLVGEIISRFERKGFKLVGLKLFQTPKELAEEHYKDLSERPFYPDLVSYIISGPVVCMAWEGNGVVKSARKLIGATNPLEAEPGTIRGDLSIQTGRNIVHGSDSIENGEREVALWFNEGEVISWSLTVQPWLTE